MLTLYSCSSCSAPVRRLTGSDTREVLCANCTDSGVDAMRALVTAQANESLERQLARFDGAGGYLSASLSTNPTAKWERAAVAAVDELRTSLTRGRISRGGLVLIGPAGIGKTRAAIAICRAVGQFDPAGVSVSSEADLLAPQIPPWELPQHIRRTVAGKRCVLVDDIGSVARPTDQVMSAWKFLLDFLRAADHPTLLIVTTNRQTWAEPGGLADWMGAQSVSRLREIATMGTTGWTDHRTGHDHEQWKAQLNGGRR
ncbi:ATP-binding protein [Gordonia sihwensis]|uniref:ATP-binding protein n=1 Tax=Gordonia sihwensis TaxID=173559 RepID=UPI0005EE3B14|nr:ATP-binding protein [Gordonia sihwensis]KJR10294.1 hypothetical protein UG54_01585 [Gordonia sihwensis]